ncbi:MAG: 4-carboxymuconolactone decarboxylase [Rhodobacteraceae bacterium HLUCCA12]|nr:MAG: 4-carboxymuconolactone decarboxylase [Rhodobacteraceae bacterium HLUCCA12]
MSWLSELPPSGLTPLQAEVRDEAQQGPRGKMPAPMIAWLRRPEMARQAQALGAELRFRGVLEPQLRELAILVCARHWSSHYEWTAHKRIALDAGLDPEIIAAIARDDVPPADRTPLALVWRLSREILDQGKLGKETRSEALSFLGEEALVELVMVLGYYCLVALTLNAFELGLPEAVAPELLRQDRRL